MKLAPASGRRKIVGLLLLAALLLTLINKLADLGAVGEYDSVAVAITAAALYFALMFRR